MKLSFAAAFLFLAALSLSVSTVSAQSAKCSLKLKIRDNATEKALIGATGVATDTASGESIDAVAKEDELLFQGLTQSNTYEISFSRKDYKRTLVESYIPNCTGTAGGVIDINAYMQKGDESDVYLAGAKVKYPYKGVINGTATRLVRPAYPPTAKAAGVSGHVEVEVVIDEQGKVISAVMLSGHPFLKITSLSAARSSTFKPTVMDGKAVKVRGVIVYSFY